MSTKVHCPKCQSESISANQKGFSGKKAVAGAVLTGSIGLLAGTIGSKKDTHYLPKLRSQMEARPGRENIFRTNAGE